MRSNQAKVLGFIATIVLSAIWAPTFGNIKSDVWTRWVYNYQALIAGFAAAGAAYLTVREMRSSTDKQLNLMREQLVVHMLPEKRNFRRFYELLEQMNVISERFVDHCQFCEATPGWYRNPAFGIEMHLFSLAYYVRGLITQKLVDIPIALKNDTDLELTTVLDRIEGLKKIKANIDAPEELFMKIIVENASKLEETIKSLMDWVELNYPDIAQSKI